MKYARLFVLIIVMAALFGSAAAEEYDESEIDWIILFQEKGTAEQIQEPYYIQQGVLYRDATLVAYPQTKDEQSFTVPDGVEYIAPLAFYANEYLTEIELPDSLRMIGGAAFQYCIKLTRVDLPLHLLVIDQGAFQGCEKLADVTMQNELYAIGSQAFAETASLNSIVFPPSVRFVGEEVLALSAVQQVQFLSGSMSIGRGIVTPYEKSDDIITITVPSYEYSYVEQLIDDFEWTEKVVFVAME